MSLTSSAAVAMTLAPGARLGPYEIVSLVGAGGMGEVYRARDPRLGRDVAIKVLPAAFSADPDRLRRFEQEARAAAALNHPGDRKPRPLVHSEFQELEGQISPDGQWLAYTSDESKRWEVYVRPLSGNTGKWQVSTGGGRLPRWRGDTKELFFLTDARKLMAVEVRTSGSALEVGIPRPLFDVRIANVFFQAPPISANAKTPFPYVASRDGQRFLVTTDTSQQAVEPPITVVENWTAALKK
jgi:serine/threonine protein kinase